MADQKRRKKNLLDEDDNDRAGPEQLSIRVNKEYAARFEHNKQREELHRLQSKYPEEAQKLARKIARDAAIAAGKEPLPRDEDSSEDEEEDDGVIPEEVEAKIFDTLLRIRSQDPSIYEKDVQFFDEGDEEEDGAAGGKPVQAAAKKAKPMYLKDMIAKQAIEYGAGGDSSDDEDAGKGREGGKKRHPKAYDHEQEALRKAFLEAAVEAEEGEIAEGMGGVLRLRPTGQGDDADGGDEEDAADDTEQASDRKQKRKKVAENGAKNQGQFQQLIEAYFGSGGQLNPDDKFLKEYIVNKGWVDRDDDYVPTYREVVGDDGGDDDAVAGGEGIDEDEDETYLREVDKFEAKYNFRYEEPGAERIVTHPRIIDGIVRKPDDKRKRQRDAKKQRLEESAEAAHGEVKRLKNLKKKEIESRLDKLRNVAGAAAPATTSLDDMLEGDFDPEEWDKKMAAAFDDDYYAAEEDLGDLKDDLDLLGEDMDDSEDGEDGGAAGGGGDGGMRFRTLQHKMKEVDALNDEPEGREGGAAPDPEVAARQRAELQRLLEDYYKLDYEDNVAGIKTRFRYKEVAASSFGLSVDEILRLDDKALNQVVGIKRLAPYREDLSKLRPNYKALEMVKGEMANLKNPRRQHNKREWQKGGARQGGHWSREKGDAGSSGDRDAPAAGPGPGSAMADGSAGKEPGAAQQTRDNGRPRQDSKHQVRFAGRDDKAGLGPSSEAAAGGEAHTKKRKQQGDTSEVGRSGAEPFAKRHNRKEGQQQLDSKQARLASYAVPTLKKEPWVVKTGYGNKRKQNGQGQDAQGGNAEGPTDGLSRAQRKNLKRSQKRAGKRPDKSAGVQ